MSTSYIRLWTCQGKDSVFFTLVSPAFTWHISGAQSVGVWIFLWDYDSFPYRTFILIFIFNVTLTRLACKTKGLSYTLEWGCLNFSSQSSHTFCLSRCSKHNFSKVQITKGACWSNTLIKCYIGPEQLHSFVEWSLLWVRFYIESIQSLLWLEQ